MKYKLKYKVGDKVRLFKKTVGRTDIFKWLDEEYNWIVTIKEAVENGKMGPEKYYLIEEDQYFACKWLPKDIIDYADPIKDRFEILDL